VINISDLLPTAMYWWMTEPELNWLCVRAAEARLQVLFGPDACRMWAAGRTVVTDSQPAARKG
jgi:hypothetical protein